MENDPVYSKEAIADGLLKGFIGKIIKPLFKEKTTDLVARLTPEDLAYFREVFKVQRTGPQVVELDANQSATVKTFFVTKERRKRVAAYEQLETDLAAWTGETSSTIPNTHRAYYNRLIADLDLSQPFSFITIRGYSLYLDKEPQRLKTDTFIRYCQHILEENPHAFPFDLMPYVYLTARPRRPEDEVVYQGYLDYVNETISLPSISPNTDPSENVLDEYVLDQMTQFSTPVFEVSQLNDEPDARQKRETWKKLLRAVPSDVMHADKAFLKSRRAWHQFHEHFPSPSEKGEEQTLDQLMAYILHVATVFSGRDQRNPQLDALLFVLLIEGYLTVAKLLINVREDTTKTCYTTYLPIVMHRYQMLLDKRPIFGRIVNRLMPWEIVRQRLALRTMFRLKPVKDMNLIPKGFKWAEDRRIPAAHEFFGLLCNYWYGLPFRGIVSEYANPYEIAAGALDPWPHLDRHEVRFRAPNIRTFLNMTMVRRLWSSLAQVPEMAPVASWCEAMLAGDAPIPPVLPRIELAKTLLGDMAFFAGRVLGRLACADLYRPVEEGWMDVLVQTFTSRGDSETTWEDSDDLQDMFILLEGEVQVPKQANLTMKEATYTDAFFIKLELILKVLDRIVAKQPVAAADVYRSLAQAAYYFYRDQERTLPWRTPGQGVSLGEKYRRQIHRLAQRCWLDNRRLFDPLSLNTKRNSRSFKILLIDILYWSVDVMDTSPVDNKDERHWRLLADNDALHFIVGNYGDFPFPTHHLSSSDLARIFWTPEISVTTAKNLMLSHNAFHEGQKAAEKEQRAAVEEFFLALIEQSLPVTIEGGYEDRVYHVFRIAHGLWKFLFANAQFPYLFLSKLNLDAQRCQRWIDLSSPLLGIHKIPNSKTSEELYIISILGILADLVGTKATVVSQLSKKVLARYKARKR